MPSNTYYQWLHSGRIYRNNRRFMIAARSVVDQARRDFPCADIPSWNTSAELPEVRSCTQCGDELLFGAPDYVTECANCGPRAEATANAIDNGGRRFGIELEFSLPDDAIMDYEDDDEYECECPACNRRRRERRWLDDDEDYDDPHASSGAQRIAEQLTENGVRCIAPGYTHDIQDGVWKIVTDASVINGYELVSPPLQWCDADQVRKACDVLTSMGMQATSDCGLHVHHDCGDLTTKTAPILASNFDIMQEQTNLLVDPYRLHSEWCSPTPRTSVMNQCTFDGERLYDFFRLDGGRYRPLNWTCWVQYGTVEMRMHESTLDPEEILAWVAYGQGIVDASMAGELLKAPTCIDDALSAITIRQGAKPATVRAQLKRKAAANNNAQDRLGDIHWSTAPGGDDWSL